MNLLLNSFHVMALLVLTSCGSSPTPVDSPQVGYVENPPSSSVAPTPTPTVSPTPTPVAYTAQADICEAFHEGWNPNVTTVVWNNPRGDGGSIQFLANNEVSFTGGDWEGSYTVGNCTLKILDNVVTPCGAFFGDTCQ